jgi:hypothetical protein
VEDSVGDSVGERYTCTTSRESWADVLRRGRAVGDRPGGDQPSDAGRWHPPGRRAGPLGRIGW